MRRIDWFAVTVLLLFAAALRILGISFGQLNPDYFPSYAPFGMVHEHIPIHPDEFYSVGIPLNMALRDRRNPEFFNYPSFIINTNLIVFQFTGALDGLALSSRDGLPVNTHAPFSLYVFSRMYSVLGALLTTACAYAIARMLAGPYAALCSGLILACSFTLVQHAHYIKPGTLAAGWMMLATYASFAALNSRRKRVRDFMVVFAGITAGLASTTRYNAMSVCFIVALSGLLLFYCQRTRRMAAVIGVSWLMMPLVFILGSPYILLDFAHFWRDFSYIFGQYTSTGADIAAYFLVDPLVGLGFMLTYAALFAIGLPALTVAALPLLVRWRFCRLCLGFGALHTTKSAQITMLGIFLLLYSFVALRTVRPGHSDGLLIFVIPFVAILSGVGADWIVKRLPLPQRLTMPFVALLLVIQPLVLSVQVVEMFRQRDTRQIMLDWIHEYIPRGSRFLLNGSYNVPLDESLYPNISSHIYYDLNSSVGEKFDYMIYSDVSAFDILRSPSIVPPAIIEQQRDYLQRLDVDYSRIAEIHRPTWTGSQAMMNMAAFWHNPTLILYCLNMSSCENHR